MAEGGARFLMRGFAMDHYRVILGAELGAALPHLLHEGAGGVVFQRVDADGLQFRLGLQRGSEGRDDHDVIGGQFVPIHEHLSMGILDEAQAVTFQIRVHLGVVDHLAEQEDPLAGVLLQRLVTDLDGVLHPVAKAEVSSEDESYSSQVEHGRREVFFLRILRLAEGFQSTDEVAAIVGGDLEGAQSRSENEMIRRSDDPGNRKRRQKYPSILAITPRKNDPSAMFII